MSLLEGIATLSLVEMVEARVRQSTHNRIRNLSVAEIEGRLVVVGQVASQHMKQLALQGALELLSGDQFAAEITVHSISPLRDADT
jgi:hypothetical protein